MAIMGVAMGLTAQMDGEEEAAFLSILLSDDGRVQLGNTLAAHMRVAPRICAAMTAYPPRICLRAEMAAHFNG